MITHDKLVELQNNISGAKERQTRARIEKENAQKSLLEAKQKLVDEFNIASVSEIEPRIKLLTEEAETEAATIERLLKEAGE